ncbi:hypothetical protein [Bacillus sp. 1006-3]|uniref:hypothetical protein n=1 Tax=Bacillus sp. 1006-3 TaxID=2922309 RepID=UPI001F0F63EC|nr:hypothetical protein [Bacillus sp. 1006-3]MCH4866755.1 hypothetical protein [Bacillus sp. 1006-3]
MRGMDYIAWDLKHKHLFKVKEWGQTSEGNVWAKSKRNGFQHWNPEFFQFTGKREFFEDGTQGKKVYEGYMVRGRFKNRVSGSGFSIEGEIQYSDYFSQFMIMCNGVGYGLGGGNDYQLVGLEIKGKKY